MPLFSTYPSYERYRALKLRDPFIKGEDVYALQTALAHFGIHTGSLDGVFGPGTSASVVSFQSKNALSADGIAGAMTQGKCCDLLNATARQKYQLPVGLLDGQEIHESGRVLGNYSPLRDNGSYDAGVAQRNITHTPASEGFAVPESIEALARNDRQFYDRFVGVSGRRRWELAAGAWNAPAYASWIARSEGATAVPTGTTAKPGVVALTTLEAYMDSVTAYMK